MHQVYLDDSLWVLQGSLKQRNSNLAMLLTTMAALGLQVSLAKGERASTVHWVGVKFFLKDDLIILSLPERFTKDLLSLLKGWDNKGMAPLKELRQAAGKLSWLSGILPKARWLLSLFFRVLHDRLDDIVSGEEARRRNQRADQRPKDGLFAVKLLEQARQWLITFLDVAMERPQRAFKLDVGQYPSATIVTDASPKGMGAILLINNKLVKALAFKVTKVDAEQLNFVDSWQSSASSGIVETLAVLLALKAWTTQLKACQLVLQVQSDSMIALATTQKLSNPSPTLNFIGTEIAIQCEEMGLRRHAQGVGGHPHSIWGGKPPYETIGVDDEDGMLGMGTKVWRWRLWV